ncbi:hypothetical protein FH972_012302 [Carpinus fangiana]|uniref:Uncharacterized protein n=1 Tax=Carpinus fangiana TaxID=176857 RepID=A0A5N6R3E9_9ROSI|nr:hypothetical protein FH972_012302 [Carpinus fangiana]
MPTTGADPSIFIHDPLLPSSTVPRFRICGSLRQALQASGYSSFPQSPSSSHSSITIPWSSSQS